MSRVTSEHGFVSPHGLGGTDLPVYLEEIVAALPEHLKVHTFELRTVPGGSTSSILIARHSTAHTAAAPALDDTQLRLALGRDGPSILNDLSGQPDESWLLIPIARSDASGLVHVLVGVAVPANEIDSSDLQRVEKRLLPLGALEHVPFLSHAGAWPETLLQAIAEAVPVPLAATDTAGRLLCSNQNFLFLFGTDGLAHAGAALDAIVPESHAEAFQEALNATLKRRAAVELPLPPLQGSLGELAFTLTTTLARTSDRGSVVIHVLREVSTGLELTRLQQASDVRNYLFRTVMHDLKNPLSALQSGLQLLEAHLMAETRGQRDRGLEDVFELVDSSTRRIIKILEDLQEFSMLRTLARKNGHAAVALEEAIEPLLDVYRLEGHDRRFTVEMRGDTHVEGNAFHIARAIDNLISNAVKYSPPGSEIKVLVAPADDDDHVLIEVSDEGAGIAPQFLEKIWEPFYRVSDSTVALREGSGLGLSVVRLIIESHGGTIDVDSERGVGSTFRIRLPRHVQRFPSPSGTP